MLRDAEFFKSKVGGLDGAGDTGDYIVGLVKGKSVPKPRLPDITVVPEEVSGKNNAITNGKTSTDISAETPPEAVEKDKGAEDQAAQMEEKVS